MNNKAKEPKTTVKYRGIEYPFYKTNTGNWDFENAGFTVQDLASGSQRAMMAMTYFSLRECAKRAGHKFEDSLEDFVRNSDDIDMPAIYMRLNEEREKLNGSGEEKSNPAHTELGKQTPEDPAQVHTEKSDD